MKCSCPCETLPGCKSKTGSSDPAPRCWTENVSLYGEGNQTSEAVRTQQATARALPSRHPTLACPGHVGSARLRPRHRLPNHPGQARLDRRACRGGAERLTARFRDGREAPWPTFTENY
jgi:hypothetical protein